MDKNIYNTLTIYITTIVVSVVIYYKYGVTIDYIRYMLLIPFIINISIIDYYTTYIYDITIVSGIIIQGAILLGTINLENDYISHIIALFIGIALPYILAKITKSLGDGDVGLYGLCCFALGHNYSFYMIALSFIIAFLYCLYKIFMTKEIINCKIPFAPFISLATIIIMLTKYDILKIYFDILYTKL